LKTTDHGELKIMISLSRLGIAALIRPREKSSEIEDQPLNVSDRPVHR
jgi:hypothetical protein